MCYEVSQDLLRKKQELELVHFEWGEQKKCRDDDDMNCKKKYLKLKRKVKVAKMYKN